MKKWTILSMVALLATGCNAQENKHSDLAQNDDRRLKEEPKGTWKVNKEVDENGNITKYDSIYSWSSHANLPSLTPEEMDSIMEGFGAQFGERFGGFSEKDLPGFFQRDSLFTKEFFGEDFLNDDLGRNFSNIDDIQEQMEMLRQHFLNRKPLIAAEPEDGDTTNK